MVYYGGIDFFYGMLGLCVIICTLILVSYSSRSIKNSKREEVLSDMYDAYELAKIKEIAKENRIDLDKSVEELYIKMEENKIRNSLKKSKSIRTLVEERMANEIEKKNEKRTK